MRTIFGLSALSAFVGTIVLANWLTSEHGFVAVGLGLTATAGTYAAGLAFGFRDAVHEAFGRVGVVSAILAGAALTWWISPAFAVASGTAFLVSEMADFSVYAPLRKRGLITAVLASNVIGLLVDTFLFLWIAFGWESISGAWKGQALGKLWVTLATLAVIAIYQHTTRRREALA